MFDVEVLRIAFATDKPLGPLFRSPGHQLLCSFDEQYGWGELAQGGVAVKIISGAHEQILEEPHVQRVACEMSNCLEAASCELQGVRQGNNSAPKSSASPRLSSIEFCRTGIRLPADYPLDQSYASLSSSRSNEIPTA